MKEYYLSGSVLPKRVHFSNDDFETISRQELREARCLPPEPGPIDLDLYLLRRYDGLAAAPIPMAEGMMGAADFDIPARPLVFINEKIYNGPETVYRSTLAHEIGHLILHKSLYLDEEFPRELERIQTGSALHRGFDCRASDLEEAPRPPVQKAHPLFHIEYQANRMMVALLTPKTLLRKSVASWTYRVDVRGGGSEMRLDEKQRPEAITRVSETFHVSRTMATYRLEEVYPPTGVSASPMQNFFVSAPPTAACAADPSVNGEESKPNRSITTYG